MAKYKFKFLVFTTRPLVRGSVFKDTVAQIEVTDLNKFEIGAKWNELEKTFPKETYLSCLTETNQHLREFMDLPKPINN